MVQNRYRIADITRDAGEPENYALLCERVLEEKIRSAAEDIALSGVPIVLLAGPSGSGKTTVSRKLRGYLAELGRRSQPVSMDDYFVTLDEETCPRDRGGNIDFESPYCMDIQLFHAHLDAWRRGEEIRVPEFDFENSRRRDGKVTVINPDSAGILIFEGIHALNPLFFAGLEEDTRRVYVSARADIYDKQNVIFKATWLRLIRRLVRDRNFRGCSPERTMNMWASIRRGEKKWITPYQATAHLAIDTHQPYESGVFASVAADIFETVPDCDRAEEMRKIAPALRLIPQIDPELVPQNSLLREFIGGNRT